MIKQLNSTQEFIESFKIMKQLRLDLNLSEYLDLLKKMITDGYILIGLYYQNEIIGVAGFVLKWNLYYKKHIWIYDLVIDQKYRNQGFGEKLLNFIESFAKKENCNCIALSSSLPRIEAHKFYEKNQYVKYSYVFKKMLS